MAASGPVVLLFEDLHWADAGLLDFVEYLLEWSRSHPIFVLTLSRPELLERRPSWGAGRRSFSSLFLEPLPEEARDELLRGLVPGLPDDLRARIRERAEGVPLYAIETVRMLLDRGVLTREEGGYRVTGSVEALEVPETLQALIAARLDGLEPAERRLLEDASVLGKTFTVRGLASVSGTDEETLERSSPLSFARRSWPSRPTPSPRSAGSTSSCTPSCNASRTTRFRGRSARLAISPSLHTSRLTLVRTIPRSSRSSRRITSRPTARHRTTTMPVPSRRWPGTASPGRPSGRRRSPRTRRPSAISPTPPGSRASLTSGPSSLRARGRGGAGWSTFRRGEALFEEAIALLEAEGMMHPAARVSARLGDVLYNQDRPDAAVRRLEEAFAVLSGDERDADLAALAAQLAKTLRLTGATDQAAERVELALEIAEVLELPRGARSGTRDEGAHPRPPPGRV